MKVDIKVERVPNSKVCYANSATLKAGDTPNWINNTGDDIIVFFPHDNVLGNSTAHFHHKIADQTSYHHPGAATRRDTTLPFEQFSYAIYCNATSRFAVGGSDPEIIVM